MSSLQRSWPCAGDRRALGSDPTSATSSAREPGLPLTSPEPFYSSVKWDHSAHLTSEAVSRELWAEKKPKWRGGSGLWSGVWGPLVSLGATPPPGPLRPFTQVANASLTRLIREVGRTRSTFPQPLARRSQHWAVSSRLLRPGAARRCCVGLEGVVSGWGPSSHLGPESQKEQENH